MIGLTYIRNAYALSMQELGDKLGVSRQAILSWEKGKRKIPKARIIQMSQDIFKGIRLDYYNKELTKVEQLEVQKNRIKTEFGDKVIEYSKQITFDFEYPHTIKQGTIRESDLLNLEIEKETVMESIRLILNNATPYDNTVFKRAKVLCELLSDNFVFNELKDFLIDISKIEDETLSNRAASLLFGIFKT